MSKDAADYSGSMRGEIGQLALFLLVVFALRLAMIATSPVGLSHDEAYYWEWSRALDWGYYSKPPMIAWLIAASTAIGGSTDFFVRLPAAILSTVGLLMVYLLGRSTFDRRVAWWACLLTAATPGSVALGFLMTIDAPLMCAWSATLFCLWQATRGKTLHRRWLIGAGLAMGVGLLSKQTMMAVYPLSFIYLIARSQTRRLAFDWSYWAWGIGSLLCLTPVFWWNARNGWPTLQHTSEHFQEVSVGWGERAKDAVEFWGTQFGVYSPVTFCLIVAALGVCVARVRYLSRAQWFLACFSVVPLVGILLLSFRQHLEPNWPAPFYVAAIILAVSLVCERQLTWPGFRDRWLLPRALSTGAVLSLLTMLTPFMMQSPRLRGRAIDPLVRLHGWPQVAQEVDEYRELDSHGGKTPVLVTAGRAETAELAFYLPDQPMVSLWRREDRVTSQYDLWQREYPRLDQPLLVLAPFQEALPESLAEQLPGAVRVDDVQVEIGNGRSLQFSVYRYVPGFPDQPEMSHVAREPESSPPAGNAGTLNQRIQR